jgi:uncharacterized protein
MGNETIGSVGEIWRYPVKSMRGEPLDSVDVTECGLPGDRGWALVDGETGKVASAKLPRLWGRLLECEASRVGDQTIITFPDGRRIVAGSGDADAALAELTERAITLMSVAPEGIELQRYWPDVEGMALRDQETSAPIAAAAPPGTFYDYAVVQLLTTASLRQLASLAPDHTFDVRRFRPNLLIDVDNGASGFIENEWIGKTLAIGDDVRLRITDPTPRCVITTLPQAGLPRDIDVLKTIAANNRPANPRRGGAAVPSLGVYAVVEQAGVVQRGDSVSIAL